LKQTIWNLFDIGPILQVKTRQNSPLRRGYGASVDTFLTPAIQAELPLRNHSTLNSPVTRHASLVLGLRIRRAELRRRQDDEAPKELLAGSRIVDGNDLVVCVLGAGHAILSDKVRREIEPVDLGPGSQIAAALDGVDKVGAAGSIGKLHDVVSA
jgi:hypothetical protein